LAHGRPFAGLVKVRDPNSMIGRMIEDFLLIDRCYESEEMVNELLFLPF